MSWEKDYKTYLKFVSHPNIIQNLHHLHILHKSFTKYITSQYYPNVCVTSQSYQKGQLHLKYLPKHLENPRAKTSNVLIAGYEKELRHLVCNVIMILKMKKPETFSRVNLSHRVV